MVSLVVSLDLEVAADHARKPQESVLDRLRADVNRLDLPLTLFATAAAAEAFSRPLRRLAADGHEVGCHGTDHAPDDDYGTLAAPEAHRRIRDATQRIEAAVGVRPRVFRGPRMTTSPATQQALIAEGYVADFSPCPMRADFWRSGHTSFAEFTAPRVPFLPSRYSSYRRGEVPLVTVPLSALGVPFVSGILYLLGSLPTRALFHLLLADARLSRAPVVYLFHSYELVPMLPGTTDRRPLHQRLYERDPETRYARNLHLLRSMVSRGDVAARTAGEVARECLARLMNGASRV